MHNWTGIGWTALGLDLRPYSRSRLAVDNVYEVVKGVVLVLVRLMWRKMLYSASVCSNATGLLDTIAIVRLMPRGPL